MGQSILAKTCSMQVDLQLCLKFKLCVPLLGFGTPHIYHTSCIKEEVMA
jgi:hypothetical protein